MKRRTDLRVELLESRCLLSLAPASDFVPAADSLLTILPDYGRGPSVIVEPLPVPRDPQPWPTEPPINTPPIYAPPAEAPPDWSEEGGAIDLGGFNSPHPEVKGDPTSGSDARDVAALLAALSYVPSSGSADHEAAVDALLATLDFAPRPAGPLAQTPTEGGLVAVARAPLAAVESPETIAADLDAWLGTPVQFEGQRGRFQAFEIATAEAKTHATSLVRENLDASDDAASITGELLSEALPPLETPALETELPPADGALREESGLAEDETERGESIGVPVVINERASLSLNAVAAMAFVYLSRALKRSSPRQPVEEPKTQLAALWSKRLPPVH